MNALAQMATMMKLPLSFMNADGAGSTDSESSRERNIPAITIHSVKRETDKLVAVKMDDYYSTYRLSSAYLVMLDQEVGPSRSGRITGGAGKFAE